MEWLALVIAVAIVGVPLARRVRWCRAHGEPVRGSLFESRSSFVIYLLLRLSTMVVLVRSIFLGNLEHAFLCLLSLALFECPLILQRRLRVQLPNLLMIIVLCFIYAAEVMGEIGNFYGNVPGWDTMLHTLNGFLCAAIGFATVDLLNRDERASLRLSPGYLAFVSFCFSMTVGVMWEFVEFGADQLIGVDMQKDFFVSSISSVALNPAGENVPVALRDIVSTTVTMANGSTWTMNGYLDIGIIDTMKDLLVNFVGAVTFSIIGFFYVRHRGSGFARHFIPVVLGESGAASANAKPKE